MGLLELIGFGPKLQRLQKKMMEKFGPPENRQGAIEELGEMRSEEAVSALLMRYTFRVDPGIPDDDEEQIAPAQGITRQQEPAGREPLIQHFLKAHESTNARVREALAGLLADSPWDVKGYTPKVEAALPPAYKLDSKGKVQRKG